MSAWTLDKNRRVEQATALRAGFRSGSKLAEALDGKRGSRDDGGRPKATPRFTTHSRVEALPVGAFGRSSAASPWRMGLL